MKGAKRLLRISSPLLLACGLLVFWSPPLQANLKFTKETGQKCTACHQKIPKKGDKDLFLTELGKKFHENGNKMPEEDKAAKRK